MRREEGGLPLASRPQWRSSQRSPIPPSCECLGSRPQACPPPPPPPPPKSCIRRCNSISPRPIISPEHPFPRPPLSKDNLSVSVLNQLECPCGNNSLSALSLLFFAAANSSATPSASFTLSTTVVKGCCGTLCEL